MQIIHLKKSLLEEVVFSVPEPGRSADPEAKVWPLWEEPARAIRSRPSRQSTGWQNNLLQQRRATGVKGEIRWGISWGKAIGIMR